MKVTLRNREPVDFPGWLEVPQLREGEEKPFGFRVWGLPEPQVPLSPSMVLSSRYSGSNRGQLGGCW